nr:hypothetical protein [uncultured Mediterraneibacter sp.]
MKFRYKIGFFLAFLVLFGTVAAGYEISYRHVMDRQMTQRTQELTQGETGTGMKGNRNTNRISNSASVAAEGEAAEADTFYLKELHGFVAVYLKDGKTMYELTDIALSELPAEMQKEIRMGKTVESTEELYGFLENYSS